jgi:hypothetical protein
MILNKVGRFDYFKILSVKYIHLEVKLMLVTYFHIDPNVEISGVLLQILGQGWS